MRLIHRGHAVHGCRTHRRTRNIGFRAGEPRAPRYCSGPSSIGSLLDPIPPWKGRVYEPADNAEGANVYFDPLDVLTYAIVTVPFTSGLSFPMSGDKTMDFKNTSEAKKWYTRNVQDREYIPHSVIQAGEARFVIMLGPAPYISLRVPCFYAKPSCHIIGQRPEEVAYS